MAGVLFDKHGSVYGFTKSCTNMLDFEMNEDHLNKQNELKK
jgi:hypothetical protein